MTFLDMRTIVFTTLITNCICTLIVAVLWYQNRNRYAGLFYNVLDFACQAVALLLIAQRSSSPGWASIVATNTLVVTGTLLGYIGLEYFTDRKRSQIHNVLLIGIFVFIQTYYSAIQPDLCMRNLNICVVWLLLSLQCFWLLVYRVDRPMRPVTFGIGMVYGALSILHLSRIAKYFLYGCSAQDWLHSDTFEIYIMLGYKLVIILLTYTLVLMVNKRLYNDVEQQEEKFSKAFHSSPNGITLTRVEDGTIYEANESFQRMTGFHLSEIVGKTTIELGLWANLDYRAAFMRELSSSGSVQGAEVELRKKTGEILTALVTAEIVFINGRGELLSTIHDITYRKRTEMEREKLILELQEALTNVKTLSGLLPICSACKKIRNDKGYWEHIEQYISGHSEADFSHGVCPDCARIIYPQIYNKE